MSVAFVLAFSVAGFGIAKITYTEEYTSGIIFNVSNKDREIVGDAALYTTASDAQASGYIANSFKTIIQKGNDFITKVQQIVKSTTGQEYSKDQLRGMISVEVVTDTTLINVVVRSGDKDLTYAVATAIQSVYPEITKNVFPKIKFIVERGINVITSAEEMSYPKAQNPELAEEMDRLAKENGVSILGTGINPGHIMDLLVLVWTGCMQDVEHITSRRVNSLSPFGPTVMAEQGIGMEVADFMAKKASGEMAGHVGFAESVGMMAEGLGLSIDSFTQDMDPIVTDVDRKSPYGFAAAGQVAGVSMTASACIDGKEIIYMDHPQQIEPEQVGVQTGDYVIIKGTPDVNMVNSPEIEGGKGTIAMCANMIPQVINAEPGLHTMLTLPVPRAILGDMRDRIDPAKKLVK